MENLQDDLEKVREIITERQKERSPFLYGLKELGFTELEEEIPERKKISIILRYRFVKKYNEDDMIIIKIEHFDRCKTFMVRPDGIRGTLSVIRGDKITVEEKFGWIEEAHPGEYDE